MENNLNENNSKFSLLGAFFLVSIVMLLIWLYFSNQPEEENKSISPSQQVNGINLEEQPCTTEDCLNTILGEEENKIKDINFGL